MDYPILENKNQYRLVYTDSNRFSIVSNISINHVYAIQHQDLTGASLKAIFTNEINALEYANELYLELKKDAEMVYEKDIEKIQWSLKHEGITVKRFILDKVDENRSLIYDSRTLPYV